MNELQAEQFNKYFEMLIEWNKKINLTAITDRDEVRIKHFNDSLSIDKILDLKDIDSVIDVGTGAGFPGIPLKIMYPHIRLTLLDSLDKRIRFLDAVIDELGLDSVKTVHGRAEELGQTEEYREYYDLCVSRAVAGLNVLSELCLPFVRQGGYFVSYKSEKADEEIAIAKKAVNLLGGQIEETKKFMLEGSDNSRTLIKIKKVMVTPDKYPRRPGIPSKKPL